MTTRVVIADDHGIVREGLRSLLAQAPTLEVVGLAENGRMALALVEQLQPELLILDIALPDLTGIEVARRISKAQPAVRILALSTHTDRQYVTEMLKAGAAGYLVKDCVYDELLFAIAAVLAGQAYLSPAIAQVMVAEYRRQPAADPATETLSAREREILQLLAQGATGREIADQLCIGVKTVETHRRNIMEKLHAHSIADLIKYAIRMRIITLDP
jgi:two-component system response regulator NreC